MSRGTKARWWTRSRARACFYSLSRRAYSGTDEGFAIGIAVLVVFLFAVAKGVQRNLQVRPRSTGDVQFLFAVAKGVQRNTLFWVLWAAALLFLFAVAKGVQRNIDLAHKCGSIVSIRCREGRTAERLPRIRPGESSSRRFYSLSRRAYSGTSRRVQDER